MISRPTLPPSSLPVWSVRPAHARLLLALLGLLLLAQLPPAWPARPPLALDQPGPPAPPLPAPAPRPLAFMPGPTTGPDAPRFQATALGGTLHFRPSGVDLQPGAAGAAAFALRFVDAAPGVQLQPAERLPGVVHLLLGRDPAAWRTHLPTFGALDYQGLYPGIDLRYDGTVAAFKGTYTVAAGADPAQIRWRYADAGALRVDGQGHLHIPTTAGVTLREQAPVAWQEQGGQRAPVAVRFALGADGSVGFALGAYDRTAPLTIDPVLSYTSYLGGSGAESAQAVAVETTTGNVYVVGTTSAAPFVPDTGTQEGPLGKTDVFVSKLDHSGRTVLYTTYLGGDEDDSGAGIALGSGGVVYLTGTTESVNFPRKVMTTNRYGGAGDAFMTKLTSAGTIEVSTYIGGSARDEGAGIALGSGGVVYLTGTTLSDEFPTKPTDVRSGGRDAFVMKMIPNTTDAGYTLGYSNYLGGSDDDYGTGIAIDSTGAAYVTGHTGPPAPVVTPSPTTSTTPSATTSTTPSATTSTTPSATTSTTPSATTSTTPSATTSTTPSATTSTTPSATTSATPSATTSATPSATPTPGDGTPTQTPTPDPKGILGNVRVNATPTPVSFPTTNQAYQGTKPGRVDAFVTKFNSNGSLAFSTFLGSTNDDRGAAIAIRNDGVVTSDGVYVTGSTNSTNFPTVSAADTTLNQTAGSTNSDAFVAKLSLSGSTLRYSTYLGGDGNDMGAAITVNSAGEAFVVGSTTSSNFPVDFDPDTPLKGPRDAFVTKIKSDGKAIVYSALLGGPGEDTGAGVGLDNDQSAYVVGRSGAPSSGTSHVDGTSDAFVIKIGELLHSDVEFLLVEDANKLGVGQEFTLDLRVKPVDLTVDGAQAYLDFNKTYLEVVSVTLNSAVTGTKSFSNTNGTIEVKVSRLPASMDPFSAATIRMRAKQATPAPIFVTSSKRSLVTSPSKVGSAFLVVPARAKVEIVAGLWLNGQVTLQTAPNTQIEGITDFSRTEGSTVTKGITLYQPGTSTVVGAFSTTTDVSGTFELALPGVAVGTYDIRFKGDTTLSAVLGSVNLTTADPINVTLIAGDSNGDDQINGADISYIMPGFGGAATARPYANVNKDQLIDGGDISAIRPNLFTVGPTRPGAAQVQRARPQASATDASAAPAFNLQPAQIVAQPGDVFTMTLAVDLDQTVGDTIDAYLDLDSRYLELVDIAGQPAQKVTPDPLLGGRVSYNQVVTANGVQQIGLSVTRFNAPFMSGQVPIATLRLRAKAAVPQTAIRLVQDGTRRSEVFFAGRPLQARPTQSSAAVRLLGHSLYLPTTLR